MYLNHGNKTYNFDAQYRRTFEFTASKQTGSSDSNALQFAITKDKDSVRYLVFVSPILKLTSTPL